MRRSLAVVALLACTLRSDAGVSYPLPKIPDGFQRIDAPDYVIFHDLTEAEGAEVVARMTAMAREYETRTRGFAGRIQGRMPFLLFRREADYITAGGMDGSAGMFNPNNMTLMAVAGKKLTAGTWHTIQHEGFHQYAKLVIGGELPPWVNEGMAEYFGEGIYCGDGFVTGGIPGYRLARIQESIKAKQFTPAEEMMRMSHEKWNSRLTEANYDQAWAMVQFLAHADDGKYQKPFVAFMNDLARGHPQQSAWQSAFGSAEGFDAQFEAWWLARPKNPTLDVYATAGVRMLANYAARAASQQQAFASIDDLLKAVKSNSVKSAPGDVLPPGLAADATSIAGALAKTGVLLAMEFPKKGATQWPLAITATLPDGRVIRGTTPTRGPRAGKVDVSTATPPKKAATRGK